MLDVEHVVTFSEGDDGMEQPGLDIRKLNRGGGWRYVCLAAWWCWIWLMFFPGNSYVKGEASTIDAWSIYLISASIMALVLATFPRLSAFALKRRVVFASNLIIAIGTALLYATRGAGLSPAVVCLIGALSSIWGTWCLCDGNSERLNSIPCHSAAMFVGSIGYLLLIDRPLLIEASLTACIPFMVGFVIFLDARNAGEKCLQRMPRKQGAGNEGGFLIPISLLLCTATFGTCSSIITTMSHYYVSYIIMLSISLITCIIALAALHGRALDTTNGYAATITLFVLGLVMLVISVIAQNHISILIISIIFVAMGWSMSIIIGFNQFITLSEHSGEIARRASLGVFFVQFGTLLGTCAQAMTRKFAIGETSAAILPMALIAALVVLLSVAMLRSRSAYQQASSGLPIGMTDQGGAFSPSTSTPTAPSTGPATADDGSEMQERHRGTSVDNKSESIDQFIVEKYSLSDREYEVFKRLMRGHNLPRIASELNLAKSTVATHCQHIYKKLGVHSRQEFISFVERYYDE